MSKPCDTANVPDKQVEIGIQEYLNKQKTLQKTQSILISINGLQEYLANKYSCIPPFDETRIRKIANSIIEKRNKLSANAGSGGQIFAIGEGVMQILVTPPAAPRSIIPRRQTVDQSRLMVPGTMKQLPPLSPTTSPKISPKQSKPQEDISLPPYTGKYFPGTNMWQANDMSEYYDEPTNNPDELKYRDKRHGHTNCGPDLSCPQYYACDIDRKKCLLTDKIPALSWMKWKGKAITGSGRTLVSYLLSQGVPMDDIIGHRVPATYTMEDYLDFVKVTEQKKPIAGITLSDLTPVPSHVIQVKNFTLSTKRWPAGLTMIPDFMNNESEQRILFSLYSLDWKQPNLASYVKKDTDTMQFGYIYNPNTDSLSSSFVLDPPPTIKCLADLLFKHSFMPHYPNQITITRFTPGQGSEKMKDSNVFESPTAILSLGSPVIMKFEKGGQNIDVPLLQGSLAIVAGDSRTMWTRQIPPLKSESYKIPHLPVQQWDRKEYISVVFRTIRNQVQ